MKLICSILFFMLCLLADATNVQFILTDPQFGISQTTNIEIIVQQETPDAVTASVRLLPLTLYGWTDNTGQYTFTNIFGNPISGYYHVTIPANSNPQGNGPNQTWSGDILVTSTNLGTISSTSIGGGWPATYPSSSWAWAWYASDLRYQQNGTNASNQFYPLYGNPSNYVQNATLINASNALVALIPSTNGFVSAGITNGFVGAGITNGLATTNYVNSLTNEISSNITNGLAGTNWVGNGFELIVNANALTNASATTNFVNSAIQNATNLNSSFATTNYVNTATGTVLNSAITIIQNTNTAILGTLASAVGNVSNQDVLTSNTLQFAKQPANTILTNLSVTGANTNVYLAGVGIYLTTNFSGNIQSINASNQVQLTNGITGTAYAPFGSYLGTNTLPAATNGFVPASITNNLATVPYVQNATNGFVPATITNGLAPTNWVGQNFALQSSVPGTNGLVTSAITNGLAGTNWTGNNFVLVTATNSFANTNQVAQLTNYANSLFGVSTNFSNTNVQSYYGLGTNYANTNTQSYYQSATNFAATNTPTGLISETNGSGTSLYLTTNLIFGQRTNFIITTKNVAVLGNGSAADGTYYIGGTTVWTNVFIPYFYITNPVPGGYYLFSNSSALYGGTNLNSQWTIISGIGPAPLVFTDINFDSTGVFFKGWFWSTNLQAQINSAVLNLGGFLGGTTANAIFSVTGSNSIEQYPLGGYLNGTISNGGFSATGTNTIVNLIAQYAENPTNGISAATATNIALGISQQATNGLGTMAFQNTNNGWVNTNGNTAIGQIPYSTNVFPGFVWAAPPSGGGGGSATNAIGNLNGLGTNTTIYGLTFSNASAIGTNGFNFGIGNLYKANLVGISPSWGWVNGNSNVMTAYPSSGVTALLNNILGGAYNLNESEGYGFIGNGESNMVESRLFETVVNGSNNIVHGDFSFIGNGANGSITPNLVNSFDFIEDGFSNLVSGGTYSFIGNGSANNLIQSTPAGQYDTILTGESNVIQNANLSLILGGQNNFIKVSPGGGASLNDFIIGSSNVVGGTNAIAMGSQTTATNSNTLIWSDGTPIHTLTNNTIVLNAANGVAINTNNPAGYTLNIYGSINATNFYVNGSLISGNAGASTYNQLFVANVGSSDLGTNYNGIYTVGFGGYVYTNDANTYAILLPGNYVIDGVGYNIAGLQTITNLSVGSISQPPIYENSALFGSWFAAVGGTTGSLIVSPYYVQSGGTITIQMVSTGTNNPNGNLSAPIGAIYNQFSAANTNIFIGQWVNTNNSTGWQ